jgi:hypothetical protein
MERAAKTYLHLNLARLHLAQNQLEPASHHLSQGLSISQSIGHRDSEACLLSALANLHRLQQPAKLTLALSHHQEALALRQSMGLNHDTLENHLALAHLQTLLNHPEQARPHLETLWQNPIADFVAQIMHLDNPFDHCWQTYQVLHTLNQPETAQNLLNQANRNLEQHAQSIADTNRRHIFLTHAPSHQALRQAWGGLSASQKNNVTT